MRDHGDLIFIDLREDGEIFQIKVSKDVFGSLAEVSNLTDESVILCEGKISLRSPDDINPQAKNGNLELDTTKLHLLSKSAPLPFEIRTSHQVRETKRMQYRFLDLRNLKIRENIIMRHQVISEMRTFLNKKSFTEIETPIVGKATDEGAREFIIPSRLYPGEFYVLPQSPQQLKQLLVGSGIDKYYQIAKCFRDEDGKGDRQPEFTQLDIELAFTSQNEVIHLISDLLIHLVKTCYPTRKILQTPIPLLDYADAMEWYGTDKPDLRYGLKMTTVTEILHDTSFEVFKKPLSLGGVVKCLKVEQGSQLLPKKYLDEKLREFSIQQGLGGLANFHVGEDNFITEKLGTKAVEKIIKKTD